MINTHHKISQYLCGSPVSISEGVSSVELKCTENMTVDNSGLIHGGFIFGLADYAAMLASNHPNVVLGGAETKFLKPVVVGDSVIAKAKIIETKGKKLTIEVKVKRKDQEVFQGTFTCFELEKHVLS